MDSELFGEVIEGVKVAAGIEALLILTVASLHFTIVARRVGSDELVPDTQFGSGGLKQSREILLVGGIGGLLWVGGQEAQTGELVNSNVLV